MNIKRNFPDKVEYLMADQGLTYSDLAEKLREAKEERTGREFAPISKSAAESVAKSTNPHLTTIRDMATALGVEVKYFFEDTL